MDPFIYLIPVIGLVALLYSYIKSIWINKQSVGTEKMAKIAENIRNGAIAFLRTEYKVLAIFVVAVALILAFA